MNTIENPVAELKRLIDAAGEHDVCLRGMGGIAFEILCNTSTYPDLSRVYKDFDIATRKTDSHKLGNFFNDNGYLPDNEFNILNGDLRQIFFDPEKDRHIDIFIERFEMCHKIHFGNRLALLPFTLTPVDLFLTKAQIVQLNPKDIKDIIRLLITHAPEESDSTDKIDLGVINQLVSKDWGLYTTVSQALDKTENYLKSTLRSLLTPSDHHIVLSNIEKIRNAMAEEPKTQVWKLRAKIGIKVKWYQDVEEIDL